MDMFGALPEEFGQSYSAGSRPTRRTGGTRRARARGGGGDDDGGGGGGLSLDPVETSPTASHSRGSSPAAKSPGTSPRAGSAQKREKEGSPGSRGSRSGKASDDRETETGRNSRDTDSPRSRTGSPRASSPSAGAQAPESPARPSNEAEPAPSPQTRAGSELIFEPHITQDTGTQVECIASFPGRYDQAWRRIVGRDQARQRETNAACVFFPDTHRYYGKHQMDEDTGKCYCHSIYGSVQPWGCRWFDEWTKHVKLAVERNQTLVVCYFRGQVGEGKIRWRELGMSFPERVQNRAEGKLQGLGISQAAEVAWLERQGWEYQERDAFRLLAEEQEEGSMFDAIEAQFEHLNAYTAPKLFMVKQEQDLISHLLEKASSEADPTAVVRSISDPYVLADLLTEWLRTRLDSTIPPEYCEECCSTVDVGTTAPEDAFPSVLHDDSATTITAQRLANVVEGLAQFSEVGRLRLVRLLLILQQVDARASRVTSEELASSFAPILFSQNWLDQLGTGRRDIASLCGREFVRLLIDRWVHDAGNGQGLEEIAIETISLHVRKLYASQRRLDTKQQACDDATVQFELADKEQRKHYSALTGLLSRMQAAGDAIMASRVDTIRGLCDEAVDAERKVDRIRLAHRRACIYKRLRQDEDQNIVQMAEARCDVLHNELVDAEAYVSQVYAEIDAEAYKVIGKDSMVAQVHQRNLEKQLGAYVDDLETEVQEEMEGIRAKNTTWEDDLRRLRQNIAAARNAARNVDTPVNAASVERAGQSLPVLRRLQKADDMLASLQEELQQDANVGRPSKWLVSPSGRQDIATTKFSSGWLLLRSAHCVTTAVTTWKRRWLQIAAGQLTVYTKPPSDGGELLRSIELEAGTAAHAITMEPAEAPKLSNVQLGTGNDKAGQRWCFLIIFESNSPLYVEAFSSDQRSQWIEAISAAVRPSADEPEELYDNIMAEVVDELMPHIQIVEDAESCRPRAAAAVLHDVMHNSSRVLLNKLDATRYSAVARYVQAKVVRYAMTSAICAHLMLGFVEPSLSVAVATTEEATSDGAISCTTARMIELCLCLMHLVDCCLQAYLCRLSWCHGFLQTKALISVGCIVISLFLLFAQPCVEGTRAAYAAGWLSLSHLLRLALLLDTSHLLRTFCAQYLFAVRSLTCIATVILGLVVFWTLIGQAAFLDTQYETDSDCSKAMKGLTASSFQTLHSSLSEMLYLAFGASNFPDVMLPALVSCSHTSVSLAAETYGFSAGSNANASWSAEPLSTADWFSRAVIRLIIALFFVSFLFVVLYVAFSAVLAAVAMSRKKFNADQAAALADLRKGSFLLAFKLSDVGNNGFVLRRDFERIYRYYCELRCRTSVKEDLVSLFRHLDAVDSERGSIDLGDFFTLCEMMDKKIVHPILPAWITDGFRWTWRLPLESEAVETTVLRKRDPKRDLGIDIAELRDVNTDVSPAMTFELSWDPPYDLDLYCTSQLVRPSEDNGSVSEDSHFKGAISYVTSSSPCGGQLSKHSKFNEEVITWDKPYRGKYTFEIRNDRGRSLERDQKRQGGASGAMYRCKLTFAYGGDIGVVDADGQTHRLRADKKKVIEIEGNTDDFDNKISRYEITWGGYEKIEHRIHATTPRVQRAIRALAETDPSRVCALPVSEPGLKEADKVDVCVVVGGANPIQQGVFDGIVMDRMNATDNYLDVCAWVTVDGTENEHSRLIGRKAQLLLTWSYSVAHDLAHILSAVSTMIVAGSTRAGKCNNAEDFTESCESRAGTVGYTINFVCSVAFLCDTLMKLCLLGWGRCWHTRLIRLDGCIAVLVATAMLGLLIFSDDKSNAISRTFRLMLTMRLWSCMRVFRQADQNFGFERIDALLQLLWRMTFALAPMALCLVATIYFYAAIGTFSFSMIDLSDQAFVEDTAYASKVLYWEVVNFSSLSSSYLTLVYLSIQSNWHIMHDACVQAIRGHYVQQDGMCDGHCEISVWMATLYHVSFQFFVATILTYTAISYVLENYFEAHGVHLVGSNASTTGVHDTSRKPGLIPDSLKTLRHRSLHVQSCNPCGSLKQICVRWCSWFKRSVLLYYYGQCANCNRSHAVGTLPANLVCSRVFMPTFVADWRRVPDLQRGTQERDHIWQGFQPVMLCQDCEAQQRVKYLHLCQNMQRANSRDEDYKRTGFGATDGSLSKVGRKASRKADRKAARASIEERKRVSQRSLLSDLEIAPDGPHAQMDHAEGCFFKARPADKMAVHAYSTHLYPHLERVEESARPKDIVERNAELSELPTPAFTCAPQSFIGKSVARVSDKAQGDNGFNQPNMAMFGVSVQQLTCSDVDLGESDSGSLKMPVPAILIEMLNRLVDLGAQTSNLLSAIFGMKSALEPAVLQTAMHAAQQLARRYNNRDVDLTESSDDPAVWAALLRQWHEEMPAGGRLLSWPRDRGGARTRALELGSKTHAHLMATGALKKVRAEVEQLLHLLEPCQRGSIVKLIDFFARVDRKEVGFRGRGTARNELERTLARWWFDPARCRSDADRAEQQEAGAGFISLLLNLDPSHDSAPEFQQALGELKEQREQHGKDASRALIEGQRLGEPTEEDSAPKRSTSLTGMVYTCVKRCSITAGVELNSRKVGTLRVGETIPVMEDQWLDVDGALPGPSYDNETGEVEESISPKSNNTEKGRVHRIRFQQGSQECWASVHSVQGLPLLVPRAHGKVAAFGEERYVYGMHKGRPDHPFSRGSDRRREKLKIGDLDTRVTSQSAMLGLEWARTKRGKEAQMSYLWANTD